MLLCVTIVRFFFAIVCELNLKFFLVLCNSCCVACLQEYLTGIVQALLLSQVVDGRNFSLLSFLLGRLFTLLWQHLVIHCTSLVQLCRDHDTVLSTSALLGSFCASSLTYLACIRARHGCCPVRRPLGSLRLSVFFCFLLCLLFLASGCFFVCRRPAALCYDRNWQICVNVHMLL